MLCSPAGEPVASRWTAEKKQRIRDSRVNGTRLIAETLAGLERKPRVWSARPPSDSMGIEATKSWTSRARPGLAFSPRHASPGNKLLMRLARLGSVSSTSESGSCSRHSGLH